MQNDGNIKKELYDFPETLGEIVLSRMGKFFDEANVKKFSFYFEARFRHQCDFYKFIHGTHEFKFENLNYQSVYNMYQSVEICRKTVLKRKLRAAVKLEFIFLIEMIQSYLLISYKFRASGQDIIYITLDQIEISASGTVKILLDKTARCAPLKDLTPLFDKHINNLVNIAKGNDANYLFTYICLTGGRRQYKNYIISYEFLEKSMFLMRSEFSCLF